MFCFFVHQSPHLILEVCINTRLLVVERLESTILGKSVEEAADSNHLRKHRLQIVESDLIIYACGKDSLTPSVFANDRQTFVRYICTS